MNSRSTNAEKHIALYLVMQDKFDKSDNPKFNQIFEDFFNDFQTLLKEFEVEKSLRVKDGIIITWPLKNGVCKLNCLSLPIAFQQLINTKSNYYHSKYGLTPKMSAVENIYEFEDIDSQRKEKSNLKKHLPELITLSNLSKASGKPFLVSGELKSLCEADEHFNDMSIKHVKLPAEDLTISIFSLESK
ncbi:hypothetical protein ACFLR4_00740 [Bacteroidota bacterium]